MLTPATTRDKKPTIYGLGLFRGGPIGRHRGLQEAGHGGGQQGVSSLLYLLPERQFGVVILSNLEEQSSLAERVRTRFRGPAESGGVRRGRLRIVLRNEEEISR